MSDLTKMSDEALVDAFGYSNYLEGVTGTTNEARQVFVADRRAEILRRMGLAPKQYRDVAHLYEDEPHTPKNDTGANA